jgi:alkaline phosphatase D
VAALILSSCAWSFGSEPTAAPPVSIVVLADAEWRYPAPVFATAAAHGPALVLQIGDLSHDNPVTRKDHQQLYRRALTCKSAALGCDYAQWLGGVPLLHTWDDHDYCDNNSDATCPTKAVALDVFRETFPGDYPGSGVWRAWSVGGLVRVFMLDTRSQATPNGWPDGPGKTLLGAAQEAWLIGALTTAPEPWKVIVTSRPWNPTCKPADSWGAFPTAQVRLLSAIEEIPGVVFVSGDQHSGGAADVVPGYRELSVPHTNLPLHRVDSCDASPTSPKFCGHWSLGRLSGTVGPGYGLLVATPTTLTVEARGVNGELRVGFSMALGGP